MTAPLTLTIKQAAERLGPICSVSWIKHNIKRIPHRKSGDGRGRAGRIGYTEADLQAILQLLLREPPVEPESDDYAPVTRRRSA